MRHIIHSLTDSSGELGGELELGRSQGVAILDEATVAAAGDAESTPDWENWLPAPSDADPSKLWTGKRSVSMRLLFNKFVWFLIFSCNLSGGYCTNVSEHLRQQKPFR